MMLENASVLLYSPPSRARIERQTRHASWVLDVGQQNRNKRRRHDRRDPQPCYSGPYNTQHTPSSLYLVRPCCSHVQHHARAHAVADATARDPPLFSGIISFRIRDPESASSWVAHTTSQWTNWPQKSDPSLCLPIACRKSLNMILSCLLSFFKRRATSMVKPHTNKAQPGCHLSPALSDALRLPGPS